MPAPLQVDSNGHERPQGLLDERLAWAIGFGPGDVARLRASYAGNVTLIDDQVGALLGVVEERGELDRTVVALASDHGEMNGDYNLLYKENFLDPAARIPFIVRLPPSARPAVSGAVSDAMVEFMDLGATLAELAGAAPVDGSLARSVVPQLSDPAAPHRELALSEYRRELMGATGEWVVALNRAGEVYLLYDVRADPCETRNVAGSPEHAQVERDLARRLQDTVAAAT
jgi:choline-sulfatase